MAKISGWKKDKYRMNSWLSEKSKSQIKIGTGETGVFHVFYNPDRTISGGNRTIHVAEKFMDASKFAIEWMRSHPRG